MIVRHMSRVNINTQAFQKACRRLNFKIFFYCNQNDSAKLADVGKSEDVIN